MHTRGDDLYAATELGDHLAWELRVFSVPHCELLREVARDVPVVWEGGRPVPAGVSDLACPPRQGER